MNVWGLVAGASTPWCVADNTTSSWKAYTGGAVVSLVVTVPAALTGVVFNAGSGYAPAAMREEMACVP